MTASNAKNEMTITAPPDEPVIVLTREFNAPRELVFAMHTRPEHVKRWWGPRYITLLICEIDLRPGGEWRYVFSKGDGPGMTFKGVYQEVVPPERLVYTFIFDVEHIRDHPATVTTTFEDLDGRTKMTQITRHDTFAARDGHFQSGMESGAKETMDRLEELLASGRGGRLEASGGGLYRYHWPTRVNEVGGAGPRNHPGGAYRRDAGKALPVRAGVKTRALVPAVTDGARLGSKPRRAIFLRAGM